MKIRYINHNEHFAVSYPIGKDLDNSLKLAEMYTNKLIELGLEKNKCINLIVQGSSGAILGAYVSLLLKNNDYFFIKICHIKKDNENSHFQGYVLYSETVNPINIIIDDFSNTGTTLNRIYKKIKENVQNNIVIDYLCVATIYKQYLQFRPKTLITSKIY